MITTPTVLVLGAGASQPYEFPTGSALIERIQQRLRAGDERTWHTVLSECGISQDESAQFASELHRSQQSSVDAFLEYRTEFLKVGKLAIALALIPNEKEDILLNQARWRSSFYQYLFSCLHTSFDSFDENKLSIVTFNYDRSIEHYLFTALKHTHDRADEDCAAKLGGIPIVHVHGTLSPLPWQSEQGRAYIPSWDTAEVVWAASQSIKVVSEGEESSPEFQQAFQLMNEAERIYFLGFGYNPVNLERLGVDRLDRRPYLGPGSLSVSARALGTSLNMRPAEMQPVQGRWGVSLPDGDGVSNCLEFLRTYALLD